tara:strand:- start:673 stop:960 length:288 start_codon:yes stop_codon:yes gene_type:complete
MDTFNDNMIPLKDVDAIEFYVSEKANNYFVLSEDYLNIIISNVYSNNLLILFSLTFFSTLYCCAMKHRRKYQDYVVLAHAEPIKGTIVESNENKV